MFIGFFGFFPFIVPAQFLLGEVADDLFAENVAVTAAVEDANLLKFMKEMTERSDGRCTPVTIGTGYMKKDEI